MSDPRQLVFNDYDTVGMSHPTIDGLMMADAGVITGESVESGYINAGRVTIGDGALTPVTMQAVRDGNTLILSIMCRADTSFDDNDCVVIALRPSGASNAGPQRRIDIYPLWGDFPMGQVTDATIGTGFGADRPNGMDASQHLHDAPEFPAFDVHTNKPKHIADYWQRAGTTGAWQTLNLNPADEPAKFDIKCRSWRPSMASVPDECAWSIEVRFPLSTAGVATSWINLQDDFGIFVNVIRQHRIVLDPDPVTHLGDLGFQATQYVFPITPPLMGDIVIDANYDVPDSAFGHGLKGPATANANGVRFKDGVLGIGCRLASDPPNSPIGGGIDPNDPNSMVAKLENTGAAANGITAQVYLADFGLPPPLVWSQPANLQQPSPPVNLLAGSVATPSPMVETVNHWSLPIGIPAGSHRCMWIQLDAPSTVVFAQGSIRRNMNFFNLSSVTRDITVSGDQYPEPIDGSGEHEFLLRTRCRKIIVKQLAKAKGLDSLTTALVSAALTHDAGGDKPFTETVGGVAKVVKINAAVANPQWENTVVYLWITEGHRRTGHSITVRGIKSQLYDAAPGEFAFVARHEGVNDNMNWAFAAQGADMARHGPGAISVKVPHKGSTRFFVTLSAGPDIKPGDQSTSIPPAGGRPVGTDGGEGGGGDLPKGCLAMLMGLFGKKA